MTVKQLIDFLKTVDPNLTVICDHYSDFEEQEEPTVIEVIKDRTGYRRYYPNQHNQNPAVLLKVIKVLHFEGN